MIPKPVIQWSMRLIAIGTVLSFLTSQLFLYANEYSAATYHLILSLFLSFLVFKAKEILDLYE